jgi:hypothetical protein
MITNGVRLEAADSRNPVMEKLPDLVPETQFLQDIRCVSRHISDIIETVEPQGARHDTTSELLRLALSIEGAFAVWCLRHVQLERVTPNPTVRSRLEARLEVAIENANRLAERLHQITGTTDLQLDWLPSTSAPVATGCWNFNHALLEEMTAEIIAVSCYRRLVDYVKRNDPATAVILANMARTHGVGVES